MGNFSFTETVQRTIAEMHDEITALKAENAKLRDLASRMAQALRVGSGWCDVDCARAFGCDGLEECPIETAMRKLGMEE